MNNITLNWSAEDRARMDKLIGLLEQVVEINVANGIVERVTVDEVLDEPEAVAEQPQEAPQDVMEEQMPLETATVENYHQEVEEAAPAPTVSKQDILQKVIALCGAGKKAEAKDVITTYADSVSDLPDSALDEVWDKLTALEEVTQP